MWRTWLRRRPADSAVAVPELANGPADLELANRALAVETPTVSSYDELAGLAQDSINIWTVPYSTPTDADETPEPLAEAALYFAFDDAPPDNVPAFPNGWWLPPPSPEAVAFVSEPEPIADLLPRGPDRIAMLLDLRGRFDPDQFAGQLATIV